MSLEKKSANSNPSPHGRDPHGLTDPLAGCQLVESRDAADALRSVLRLAEEPSEAVRETLLAAGFEDRAKPQASGPGTDPVARIAYRMTAADAAAVERAIRRGTFGMPGVTVVSVEPIPGWACEWVRPIRAGSRRQDAEDARRMFREVSTILRREKGISHRVE